MSFLPPQIAGCVLWLRADKGVTIATGVSAWADQSINGFSYTQGTPAAQPSFSTNGGPTGGPCLNFTAASSQFLSSASLVAPSALTMFGIIKGFVTTVNAALSIGDGTHGAALVQNANSLSERDLVLNNVVVCADANSSVTSNWEGWTATCTAGANTLRVNGASRTISNSSSSMVTGGTATFVGSDSASVWFWNGSIAELIAYSRVLSAGEIATVEAYFLSRYGLL